jgi:hypothetical protein
MAIGLNWACGNVEMLSTAREILKSHSGVDGFVGKGESFMKACGQLPQSPAEA